MGAKGSVLAMLAVALLAGGCGQSPGPGVLEKEAAGEAPVWPQPPLRPRIRYVRTVKHPADLGIQPSFWQRVKEFVAGAEEEWFIRPTGVAARGRIVYVADPGSQALWILDPEAGSSLRVQEAGGERLVSPVSVAPGRGGDIYLADSHLAKVFVYSPRGELKKTIGLPSLRRPAGLAYDEARGRLYVADSAAHRVWVLNDEGALIGEIGKRGTMSGEFNFPTHVAVDREGALYVTDGLGFRLQFFTPAGEFTGQFGRHGDSSGDFARPKGVATDSEGHIYVVESLFDAIQIFDRNGRYLLTFGERGIRPGQFWLPGGIFIDSRDRIYVADAYNQRVQIFEHLPGGFSD